jgi:hypothetical protein
VVRDPISAEVDVAVLGGGCAGLLSAVALRRAGVDDVHIIEMGGDFGGVWYWNRFPGIQCDNDSYCCTPLACIIADALTRGITTVSSKVLPAGGGGDTEFCNTYAAYDDLSDQEKLQLDQLRVMHSAWNTLFYYEPEPSIDALRRMMAIGDQELPLVCTHRSGRKSLVLGCTARHVLDTDFKQSAELLVRLRDWATQPQFVYSHKWAVGDLVIWDNTGTMHRAMPYDAASGRLLKRTKLQGEEPFA